MRGLTVLGRHSDAANSSRLELRARTRASRALDILACFRAMVCIQPDARDPQQ